jgi:hypothetical protein
MYGRSYMLSNSSLQTVSESDEIRCRPPSPPTIINNYIPVHPNQVLRVPAVPTWRPPMYLVPGSDLRLTVETIKSCGHRLRISMDLTGHPALIL